MTDEDGAEPVRPSVRPLAYTVDEAAALIGVSASRIRAIVEAGTLPRVPGLGRSVRIPSRALFELVGEPVPPIVALGVPVPVRRPRPESSTPRPTVAKVPAPRAPRPAPHPPATRRAEPTVEGPVRVRDRRLWLLADSEQYRLATWHMGEDAALCGRAPARKWKRSKERSPTATMCPACLTLVAQEPGVDLATVPIGLVAMLRQTRRGTTTTVIRTGWHMGDGRVTKCGKRTGPWALTERFPDRRKVCFECGERDRWEQEKHPDSVAALEADGSWSVLIDARMTDEAVVAFLRDAPGLFAARRAGRAIEASDGDDWGNGLRELFRGGQVVTQGRRFLDQFAPDLVVTENEALLATQPEKSWHKVAGPAAFIAHWTPAVERAFKVKALRDRWDREAKSRRRRSSTSARS